MPTKEKRTQNEAIFRAANERLKDRLSDLEAKGLIPFVCECGDRACLQPVELSPAAYEAVREHDSRFFMVDGHQDPETETVVGRQDGFLVTEKRRDPS